ncbi:MAG TPA: T9SS type A sorting domain-containing protein [Bacteroidia bacterium]|nr:T9SS type A sorting domain-containing protein [Bacteroidia bacterium]
MKLKLLLLTCLIAFTVNAQKIYTVAGTSGANGYGYSGDGGLADTAKLQPQDVVVDAAGNMFIADNAANVIRMVNTAGIISTYAGTGSIGYTGDGGAATAATFSSIRYLTFDAVGNLYVSDENNGAIRMINSAGIISTYAGGGFTGDNGPALGAYINSPWGICFDSHNNLYIAEFNGSHIRMVNSTGTISTVAGSAAFGSMGDGGSATTAEINHPTDVACDINDNLYICDRSNNRIRVVSGGIINNFAGNASNVSGFSGDGAAATAARLNNPTGISFDAAGNLYIADMGNNRIRKVTQSNGFISTIAGTNTNGYNGDDILATTAYLNSPTGVTAVTSGTSGVTNIYVADQGNNIVREITNNCIAPTVVLQPTLGPVCLGSTAYFTTSSSLINATGWQWQINKGTGWSNLVGFGYTNPYDTVSNVTMAKNGWKYRCKIIGCSNAYTDSVTLMVIFPNVTVTSASVCPGNNPTTLTASGANTYTWSTSVNDTLNHITETPTVTTTYTVIGTDTATTCTFSAMGTINVLTPPVPSICLVTTDTMSINNIVYWDKTPYGNVDSFIVYRQVSTGTFKRIGAQPYSALSQFIDTARSIGPSNGDPNITTYQYKLQTRDTCGNYSIMSPYHNTVHVNNNNGSFTWNLYSVEGTTVTPVSSFDLMRDNANTGIFVSIGNAAGNQTNLTDPNYTSFAGIANWRIDASGFNCNPTQRLNGNNSTLAAKVKSHSNQNNNRMSGIKQFAANNVSIYPNPATNALNINFANAVVNKASVKIFSLIGSEVLSAIISDNNLSVDISGLAAGTYMVQISSDNISVTKKIVKE